jgi:hypothetical protein
LRARMGGAAAPVVPAHLQPMQQRLYGRGG